MGKYAFLTLLFFAAGICHSTVIEDAAADYLNYWSPCRLPTLTLAQRLYFARSECCILDDALCELQEGKLNRKLLKAAKRLYESYHVGIARGLAPIIVGKIFRSSAIYSPDISFRAFSAMQLTRNADIVAGAIVDAIMEGTLPPLWDAEVQNRLVSHIAKASALSFGYTKILYLIRDFATTDADQARLKTARRVFSLLKGR